MLTDIEKKVCPVIQGSIPLSRRPFLEIAEAVGLNENELLAAIKGMQDQGIIRKFSAIIRHQKAGFTKNAMVVWAVSEDECERAGLQMASFPEVTHCYQRSPAFEGKYNLFTMVHMRGDEGPDIIDRIAATCGITDFRVLVSEEELKKISMEYFAYETEIR
jgi:siroheme decarboxylase